MRSNIDYINYKVDFERRTMNEEKNYYFNINNYDTNYHMQLNKFIFTEIKKKQYVTI